jgi:hypothetical protein
MGAMSDKILTVADLPTLNRLVHHLDIRAELAGVIGRGICQDSAQIVERFIEVIEENGEIRPEVNYRQIPRD